MYRLKELDIRLPERGHVLKAADAGLLEQASGVIAEAERQASEILVAAQQRYQEEERRGYEDGVARATREAVSRLVGEQALLDSCLDRITDEIARLAGDCVRQLIGAVGEKERMRAFVTHAMQCMRRQKRIRLSVSTESYEDTRMHVDRVAADFPEIELIDVQENPALDEGCFSLEAETGRIEGSIGASLERIDELLRAAVRQVVPEPQKERRR